MKKTLLISIFTLVFYITGVYSQIEDSWADVITETFKVLADDGITQDEFGYSVALDQGIVAVGAPFNDDNGNNSGSAYLFEAATGTQLAMLLPNDGEANAEFGFSIAIDNGIVAVGAKGDNDNGMNAGAVYLFDVTTGNQLAKLLPEDGAAEDEFGNSVDIHNGIVAVGAWRADEFGEASGAAYLFNATTGSQLVKLLPDSGNNFQTFGVSIAIDNGIVAVGARTHFVLGQGYTFAKAYVFDVSTGNQTNVLQPDILNLNGDLGGFFADCIDIKDGLIVVGAPQRSVVFDHSGAAYVFDATSGSQLNYIVPNDAHDRDNFGISISIDNGIIAIGSHQDDVNGFNSGSAYFYDALTGDEINKLTASDGSVSDSYGSSIAIDGNFAIIGAKKDDDNGVDSGSAYIYSQSTLSISDVETDEIFLYPNPSSNEVNLKINHLSNSLNEIRIYNIRKQLVHVFQKKSNVGSDIFTLNVSELESGLYFLHIHFDDQSFTIKKLLIN